MEERPLWVCAGKEGPAEWNATFGGGNREWLQSIPTDDHCDALQAGVFHVAFKMAGASLAGYS
jgi:hypothetical protein